jgi:hypothetical protein
MNSTGGQDCLKTKYTQVNPLKNASCLKAPQKDVKGDSKGGGYARSEIEKFISEVHSIILNILNKRNKKT